MSRQAAEASPTDGSSAGTSPAGTLPTGTSPADASPAGASNPLALAALLLSNLAPVLGVLLWGWHLGDVILLYWIESGVVGLYTIAKILVASPPGRPWWTDMGGKVGSSLAFVAHYGLFWLIHGLFVVLLFGGHGPTIPVQPHTFFFAAVIISWMRADVLALPVLGLLLSHGVSFFTNFVGGGERRRLGTEALMVQPYVRVVVLQLVVMAGAALATWLGQAQPLVLLFVALKVAVDLRSHLRERRRGAAVATG